MTQSSTRKTDPRFIRGIVLGILRAYSEPNEKHEKEIKTLLPLLQCVTEPKVREQASSQVHSALAWLRWQMPRTLPQAHFLPAPSS